MTGIDTELYPRVESRGKVTSEAFLRAKKALRDERISGITGAFLALFILGHLVAESSIMFGREAYDVVANFLEHTLPLARPLVLIVSLAFFVHFVWAGRKIPGKFRERKRMLELGRSLEKSNKDWQQDPKSDIRLRKHFETALWITQVRTGMIVLAAGAFHLVLVTWNLFSDMGYVGQPPGFTADLTTSRMGSGLWILYAILMASVVAHMSIGIYRLLVKWFADTWFVRKYSRALFYFLFTFYIILGTFTIIAGTGLWEGVFA